MQSDRELREQLRNIDHKSYPQYKSLKGSYRFPKYTLHIDHVQGDPFAAPSDVRVTIDATKAGFPDFAMKDGLTRDRLADLSTSHLSWLDERSAGRSFSAGVCKTGQCLFF